MSSGNDGTLQLRITACLSARSSPYDLLNMVILWDSTVALWGPASSKRPPQHGGSFETLRQPSGI